MVSVCMATKDGGRFIKEQLDSILPQLAASDEVIISDDCSTDNTVEIIQSYNDFRLKLYQNDREKGIPKNFERTLQLSRGDFIFLADQDDVWLPEKISVMLKYLTHYDLVISDCWLINDSLHEKRASFFDLNNSGKGLIKNIVRNSYMGCCMAFNRILLNRALPFPDDIPIHDYWIGLIGELYYKNKFIPEILIYHRRHSSNASSTGRLSSFSLQQKIAARFNIMKNLFLRKSHAGKDYSIHCSLQK